MNKTNEKIDNVYVSKIENGYLLTISKTFVENGRDRYEDIKTYCATIDEVKDGLVEAFK